METIHNGLEGIFVAETELSSVDGEAGRLVLRGMAVQDVAQRASFEEACHLLWRGRLPDDAEREELRCLLADGRQLAFALVPHLKLALEMEDGMDALRACLSAVQLDPGLSWLTRAALLTGATGTFVSAWGRRHAGHAPVAPDRSLAHSEDMLRMLHNTPTRLPRARALDAYLSTVIDHGMSASTYAARVVTSTESDEVSAVVAAVGALKGPLHGGAPGPVLDMLDDIGEAERAPAWVRDELAAGRRIMGMGHRVYRVRDPRGAALEGALERLEKSGLGAGRMPLARAVEDAAERALRERYPQRSLRANVELFTAILLDALGIQRELFTPVFASSRVAGWCGHIAEQRATGRLIRPKARYVGPQVSAA